MFLSFIVAVAIVVVSTREWSRARPKSTAPDEQQFYAAVHAELRSGSSLRQAIALAAAAQDDPALRQAHRAAATGASMGEIARALRPLPSSGCQAAAALTIAGYSGGRAAEVFLRLADRAAADAELKRQRRLLTTQSRLSALIVGGLPLVWLGFGGIGRLRDLIDAGGALVAVVGAAMETIGVVLVWRLAST